LEYPAKTISGASLILFTHKKNLLVIFRRKKEGKYRGEGDAKAHQLSEQVDGIQQLEATSQP
jgi:hypothetical protein